MEKARGDTALTGIRMRIDLNSDVGESFGVYTYGDDERVLQSVSSANIACGFHAGDPQVMRRTVRLAKAAGVAIGAHPGFPDLVGFGRRELKASLEDIEAAVMYQIGALAGIAAAEGISLRHVKPHGALYNLAARDPSVALAIARAVAALDRSLILFGPAGSALLAAGRDAGLAVAAEAFADRAYEDDGSLVPRGEPEAVIHDPAVVVNRVLGMVRDGRVRSRRGTEIELRPATICTHGDTPGAQRLAHDIRLRLEAEGVRIEPPRGAAGSGQ
jgi:5-oxoprolinase (ATP-hydrolysing) subunit A